jgi:hypothetical protein
MYYKNIFWHLTRYITLWTWQRCWVLRLNLRSEQGLGLSIPMEGMECWQSPICPGNRPIRISHRHAWHMQKAFCNFKPPETVCTGYVAHYNMTGQIFQGCDKPKMIQPKMIQLNDNVDLALMHLPLLQLLGSIVNCNPLFAKCRPAFKVSSCIRHFFKKSSFAGECNVSDVSKWNVITFCSFTTLYLGDNQ